jgi:hypothetical protein
MPRRHWQRKLRGRFVAAHKSNISWDLVAINPLDIWGKIFLFAERVSLQLMFSPPHTAAFAQPRADS